MFSWWINNLRDCSYLYAAMTAAPQLFVYGSLRSGFQHPAYAYMSGNFLLLGAARTKGKLYDLGEYPGAVPCGEEVFINGELYQLRPNSEYSLVMEQIDDYEGVHAEPGETPLYRREMVTVSAAGSFTTAWIYWYNRSVFGKPLIASGDFIEYIRQKHQ